MIASGFNFSWALDGWIVLAGVLCAIAGSLLGNFLVLRRLSMLGDAVTHAVLPGLAVAFFVSSSRSSLPMFVGAVIVGVLTALFTEWIRGVGKVDEGAAMGVVFTSLFALGLVMIVQAADQVHLDADCVLYGSIELTPFDTLGMFGFDIPRAVVVLASAAILNLVFVVLFFKELKLSSFDPTLATSMGFSAKLMHYALMVLVAVTAVASFESVGNILIVAMFVVPPATAYLLTDRLGLLVFLSAVLAAAGAAGGHFAAVIVPSWFGFGSTTTAGMMAVMVGLFFAIALVFSPRSGLLIRWFRSRALAMQILSDDIVAFLYRVEERSPMASAVTWETLSDELFTEGGRLNNSVRSLCKRGDLQSDASGFRLTESGRSRAQGLVRSHRLWEQYLATEASVNIEQIHKQAERFEHYTGKALREQLDETMAAPSTDPHGTEIPPESAG